MHVDTVTGNPRPVQTHLETTVVDIDTFSALYTYEHELSDNPQFCRYSSVVPVFCGPIPIGPLYTHDRTSPRS